LTLSFFNLLTQWGLIASEQLRKRKKSKNLLQIFSNEQLSHLQVAFCHKVISFPFFASLFEIRLYFLHCIVAPLYLESYHTYCLTCLDLNSLPKSAATVQLGKAFIWNLNISPVRTSASVVPPKM